MSARVYNLAEARKPIVESALEYAARGIKVFSVATGQKVPHTPNAAWSQRLGREVKKGEGGLNMATTDPDTIRWMFSLKGATRIGMPCGEVNDVIVLDLDLHKEPERDGNAHAVMRTFYDEIEEAHQVATTKGGLHVYFQYEPGHLKHELGPNIDVQSDGAFVVVPPSRGYEVKRLVQREDWGLPPWVPTQPIREEQEGRMDGQVPDHIKEAIRQITTHASWHNPVRDIVAHLVGSGWSDAEILRWTFQWTWPGHDPRETFEEVCVMIAGARSKWDK